MPRIANPSTIINAIRAVQTRESNYRQWSERATIVGFNEATQSYEIVVSAAGPSGAEVDGTQRTLREVKSLFPTDLRTFNPGDTVLVGYVSEKKEHPIIMGLGDTRPYTGTTPQITLPTSSSGSKRVGGSGSQSASGAGTGSPESACPMRITDPQTGSTTSLTVHCSQLTPDRKLQLPNMPRVTCGVGEITWTVSGTGVTVSGTDTNGVLGEIDLGSNIGAEVAGNAYQRCFYGYQGQSLGSCVCGLFGCVSGCKDQATAVTSNPANCNIPIPVLFALVSSACQDGPDCTPTPSCPGSACAPVIPPGDLCSLIVGGSVNDVRTAPMIAAGCNPCGLALNNKTLTARDANGNTITITIQAN